jgi:hypothetical protein
MYRNFLLLLIFVSTIADAQIKRNVEITSDELLYHVSFLASDSLKGRLPGTVYDKIAAKYIRDEFKKYGLKQLGDKGYQFFSFRRYNPLFAKQAHLDINGEPLSFGNDFTIEIKDGPYSLCSNGVFVGFGDTESYYSKIDLKKKWAVIYYETNTHSYQYLNWKPINMAVKNGAAGIMLVSKDTLSDYLFVQEDSLPEIPIFIIKPNASKKLLAGIHVVFDSIPNLLKSNRLTSQELGIKICGKSGKVYNNIVTQNVIGMIQSSNPDYRNEYIVVGAHYDHLGLGEYGGSRTPDLHEIHNGADDNASGVVSMLEIAQKLAKERKKLKRNVIFIAFGAEEQGLIGSNRFVESGIIPIENIKAMVNLDMVGRLRNNTLEVHGDKSSLEADSILNLINSDSLLNLRLVPEGSGPSDHATFYAKKIPVFFIHTGLHPDYHSPKDDVEFLNINGMEKVSKYTYRLVHELATMDKPLTFRKSSSRALSSRRAPKIKVKFGIMPDVSGSGDEGLKVLGVTDEKPAAKAGIETGDFIIAINEKPIQNIYDYTDALSKLNPGEKVKVKIKRADNIIELTVEL